MTQTSVPGSRQRSRTPGAAGFLACTIALAASAALSPAPAAAADIDDCRGEQVQVLGGPHAITHRALVDAADLRQRLPELEASIRSVVVGDPSLGPVVADALIAEIRDGSRITQRPMQRSEAVRWMAYQPEPGRFAAISPACLRLKRSYDAFEITVEIPEPVTAAQTPTCIVSATRSCAVENPTIAVTVRGSSPGARVTMVAGGQPEVAVGTAGDNFTVRDPGPYDLDVVFTVSAQGAVTPRRARVFRFLMPKVCGNLAYLGEDPSKTIAAAGTPATCQQSARVATCAPVTAPLPVTPPPAVAERCGDGWVARPFLFGFFPRGSEQKRDILLSSGPARESFELDNGYGVGFALERRLGPVVGIEGAMLVGRGDSTFRLDNGTASASDSHDTTFYALTAGPNFHLLGCDGADLYLGPFLGYGGFADPNYWVDGHHFAATFDGRFLWGAQLGLDVPFGGASAWGFHGGLRYMDLSQDTDAGSIKVNPLIAEIGLSYRF